MDIETIKAMIEELKRGLDLEDVPSLHGLLRGLIDDLEDYASDDSKVYPVDELVKRITGVFRLGVVSATGNGKTYLVKELVLKLLAAGRFDRLLVYSGNVGASTEYFGTFAYWIKRYSDDHLLKLIDKQDKKRKSERDHLLIILDDLSGTEAENSEAIRMLFTAGRERKLSVIILNQTPKRVLSPTVRDNCNFWLFSRLNMESAPAIVKLIVNPVMKAQELVTWTNSTPKFVFGFYDIDKAQLFKVKAVQSVPSGPVAAGGGDPIDNLTAGMNSSSLGDDL